MALTQARLGRIASQGAAETVAAEKRTGGRVAGSGRARKPADPNGLNAVIGRTLRHLRARRGHSLDQLAKLSGVSRAMLSQIETGKSAPTINVLWKVSAALDVSITQLLPARAMAPVVFRRGEIAVARSRDGGSARRALHRIDANSGVRLFEIALAPGGADAIEDAPSSSRATLIVARGSVMFLPNGEPPLTLGEGDAVTFASDQTHVFRNTGAAEALIYIVLTTSEIWSGHGAAT